MSGLVESNQPESAVVDLAKKTGLLSLLKMNSDHIMDKSIQPSNCQNKQSLNKITCGDESLFKMPLPPLPSTEPIVQSIQCSVQCFSKNRYLRKDCITLEKNLNLACKLGAHNENGLSDLFSELHEVIFKFIDLETDKTINNNTTINDRTMNTSTMSTNSNCRQQNYCNLKQFSSNFNQSMAQSVHPMVCVNRINYPSTQVGCLDGTMNMSVLSVNCNNNSHQPCSNNPPNTSMYRNNQPFVSLENQSMRDFNKSSYKIFNEIDLDYKRIACNRDNVNLDRSDDDYIVKKSSPIFHDQGQQQVELFNDMNDIRCSSRPKRKRLITPIRRLTNIEESEPVENKIPQLEKKDNLIRQLTNWTIKKIGTKGVEIHGQLIMSNGKLGGPFSTGLVVSRKNNQLIKTSCGVIFLDGQMKLDNDIIPEIKALFINGFPQTWRKLLRKHWSLK